MITILTIAILIAVPVLLWVVAQRFDGRYRDGSLKINVKRVGR